MGWTFGNYVVSNTILDPETERETDKFVFLIGGSSEYGPLSLSPFRFCSRPSIEILLRDIASLREPENRTG